MMGMMLQQRLITAMMTMMTITLTMGFGDDDHDNDDCCDGIAIHLHCHSFEKPVNTSLLGTRTVTF